MSAPGQPMVDALRWAVLPAVTAAVQAATRKLRRGRRRHVVLYAQNRLMIEHLLEFRDVFTPVPDISFSATWQPLSAAESIADVKAACQLAGVPTVAPWIAFLRRVDLVVVADHPADRERLLFSPGVPTLHIYHAISGGKATESGVAYRHKDHRYTRVFESSACTAARVIEAHPEVADAMRTVGYLRADRLAELTTHAAQERRRLSLAQDAFVVMVQSTWGPSIMESFGEQMIAEAERITQSRGWVFVFSVHPDHWFGPWAQTHPWGTRLLEHESGNFHVIGPTERAEPFMATADVIVTDHTSQAILASLAAKPMVFFDVKGAELVVDSPVYRLRENLTRISTPEELEDAVDTAFKSWNAAEHARLTECFVSFPGAAASRVRTETMDLLGL